MSSSSSSSESFMVFKNGEFHDCVTFYPQLIFYAISKFQQFIFRRFYITYWTYLLQGIIEHQVIFVQTKSKTPVFKINLFEFFCSTMFLNYLVAVLEFSENEVRTLKTDWDISKNVQKLIIFSKKNNCVLIGKNRQLTTKGWPPNHHQWLSW